MNWLKAIFGGCQHKWQHYQEFGVIDTISGTEKAHIWMLRCQHCGDLKTTRVAVTARP